LSLEDLNLLLYKANKTKYQSLLGQVDFEHKVLEFNCEFHDDYSFKNARDKVFIIDPYGDSIEVSPFSFKNQTKPPPKTVKRDLEDKVIKRKWMFASDYRFVNPSTKVNLVCPNGHKRTIAPSKFRSGQGCATCAGNVPYTTKTFIEQAMVIHGDRYDYSLTVYPKNNKEQVIIICHKHGEFKQTVSDHINQKSGCQKCKADITSLTHSKSHGQFIIDAKDVHADTYLYDKTKYVKSDRYVIITCRKHGDFKQVPGSHLSGSGCPICANIAVGDLQRKTTECFIKNAEEIHKDKYDYSLVDYFNSHTKVKIKCSIHGIFKQDPSGHLSGRGCPACGDEKRATSQRHTTYDFIDKALRIHGSRYDYSLSDYSGWDSKLKIICSKHGEFEQIAGTHLSGGGCIYCGFEATKEKQTKTTEQFITDAVKVHSSLYNYSLVVYTGSNDPVTIVCPTHGEFEQLPTVHLTGAGCRTCGFTRSREAKTFSQEDFLKKACEHHNEKYDYSKTVYTLAQNYVTITCPTHGDFEQIANSHMIGMGCRKCAGITIGEHHRLSNAEFIIKAKEVHADKDDYSLVDYKSAKEKVKIICSTHGVFEQAPTGHLYGGCTLCANEQKGLKQRRSNDDFIKIAKEVHGDLYDYSETKYTTVLEKVKIICATHGEFNQNPRIHLRGSMCPKCSYGQGVGTYDEYYFERNREEKNAPCKFYYIKFTKDGEVRYKIGLDSNNKRWGYTYREWSVEVLISDLSTKYECWKREKSILEQFKSHRYRVKDDDFVGNGSTEMFMFDILAFENR